MKKFVYLIILLISCSAVEAQNIEDVPGVKRAKARVDASIPNGFSFNNLSGISFNHVGVKNWAAGGTSALGLNISNGFMSNFRRGRHLLQNNFFMDFGMQIMPGRPVLKNCDRLAFSTKYGFQIDKEGKWFLAPYFGFQSQFARSFNFANAIDVANDLTGNIQLNDKLGVVSRFASPLILELGLGIDFVPNKYFSLYMSPAAAKFIIVADRNIAALNIHGNNGKTFNPLFGAMAVAQYNQQVHKNVNIRSILKLYKDYMNGPAQNIDVNWETNINMQATKFISINVFALLVWDHDMDTNSKEVGIQRKFQFKEMIGVGFSYSFRFKTEG